MDRYTVLVCVHGQRISEKCIDHEDVLGEVQRIARAKTVRRGDDAAGKKKREPTMRLSCALR